MARDGISEARSTTNRAMATDGELGSSTRWVDVNGLRVHCLTAGRGGSPVVLLHGGGIDSASFTYSNIIGPLAEEQRHVFAPDWPGSDRATNRSSVTLWASTSTSWGT